MTQCWNGNFRKTSARTMIGADSTDGSNTGAERPMQLKTAAFRTLPLFVDPTEALYDFGYYRFQFLDLVSVNVEPKGNKPFAIG